jgi:hypothetical protein
MRFLLIFLLLIPLSVRAEDAPITGTYSSLYYNEEGGDLLGAEVTIIKRAKGYEAEFQVAQGGRPDKVTVPVSVKGNRISFTIPKPEDGSGFYSGKIIKAGLLLYDGSDLSALTQRNPSKPFLLKRKCSYWAKCGKHPG